MGLKQSIKTVLSHMSAEDITIFCYDYFPKLYATFKSKPQGRNTLIVLLVKHAEKSGNLKRLAKRLDLSVKDIKYKKETPSKQTPVNTGVSIGNIGGDLSGNIAGRDVIINKGKNGGQKAN